MLGLCREGRTENEKNSNYFLLSPCSSVMLFAWRASATQGPPSCPPPASTLSHQLLPPPCLGFAPWLVEYCPLWDTSSQLEYRSQPAAHRSLPPAFLFQASSFLPSQDQRVRSVLQSKTFCRASKHKRSCAKVGMAAGAPISASPPSPFLLASFHLLPTPT